MITSASTSKRKCSFFMYFRENWTISTQCPRISNFSRIFMRFSNVMDTREAKVNLQRSINDHLDRCSQLGRTCWRRFRIRIQWSCWIQICLIASWFWRNFFRYPRNPDQNFWKCCIRNRGYALAGDYQCFLTFIISSFLDPDWESGFGSGQAKLRRHIWRFLI